MSWPPAYLLFLFLLYNFMAKKAKINIFAFFTILKQDAILTLEFL